MSHIKNKVFCIALVLCISSASTISSPNNLYLAANKSTTTQNKIISLNEDIVASSTKVELLSKELQEKQIFFGERIRVMYKNKCNGSLILTLLSSKDMNDFINRLKIVSTVSKYDNKSLKEINMSKKKLDAEIKILNTKKTEVIQLSEQLNANKKL